MKSRRELTYFLRGVVLIWLTKRIAGSKMAFTLDADFLSRPARPAAGHGKQPLETEHKGADFKKSLSTLDRTAPRDEEPEILNFTDIGQTAVPAILINDPKMAPEQLVPEVEDSPDGELLDGPLLAEGSLATGASANELAPESVSAAELASEMADDLAADSRAADAITISTPKPVAETLAASAPDDASPVTADNPASTSMASQEPAELAAPQKHEAPARPADTAGASGHASAKPAVEPGPANAAAPLPAHTGSTGKVEGADARGLSTSAIAAPVSQAAPRTPSGNTSGQEQPGRERFIADAPVTDPELKASAPQQAGTASFPDTVTAGKPPASQDMSLGAQPILQQAQAPQQPATVTVPTGFTQTNALITATPAEVVDVISDSLASPDDRKNRIVVQLDPPELGRVSIDYKFDSHGLQHVTITGESPEAMRQLRLMHFELVNALEKQGLSSQNMSFQQQQAQQDPGQQTPRSGRISTDASRTPDLTIPALIASQTSQPGSAASGGLNIKL